MQRLPPFPSARGCSMPSTGARRMEAAAPLTGRRSAGFEKGPNAAATQWEISYSYSLSPRTMLYAGYVQLANDTNANYMFNINPYPTAPGVRQNGAVFGIAHFF